MTMDGYKTFHKGMKNRYGKTFQEGRIYEIEGPLKFGPNGNGIHFCKNLEDTLRFFPAMEEEVVITEVTALGDLVEYTDDYNDYYDMFCTNKIRINHIMTREEIIKMYLNMTDYRVIRFVSGFRLTSDEIELFKIRYSSEISILDAIAYYQENKKEEYKNKIKEHKEKVYSKRKKN